MKIDSIKDKIHKLNSKQEQWDNTQWKDAFFALCSEIAYLPGAKAAPYWDALGFSTRRFVESKGAQCHIIDSGERVVFVFRGTEPTELSDIAADLKAWKSRSYTRGKVHDGFYDEINKLWSTLIAYDTSDKKVFITGHSLGGAMATICASRMSNGGISPQLYTYGSPRVGNKRWLEYNAKCSHRRFVNCNDVVPKVPPAFMGFRHHGQQCYINYHGNIRPMGIWQKIKDQWRARKRAWSKKMPFAGFTDHSSARYSQKLINLYVNGEAKY